MKRKKQILGVAFIVMFVLSAFYLQKLYAGCLWPQLQQCEEGQCFNYDQAFGVCENFCVSNGHIGCAEPWWIRASCGGACNQLCLESFGVVCQDGYTARKYQYDNCAGCVPEIEWL
jgi:hypothetical protein